MFVFLIKKNIKKMFLCVAYDQYPNIFLNFLLKKQKQIFEVLKMLFSHGFFKHKNYFLAFLDFTTCL
jgi:uncharacterized membrane protein